MSSKICSNNVLSELARRELARRNFLDFVLYTTPEYEASQVHKNFANILHQFAVGKMKNLIISMPPQHGKSELATRKLPAFLFGINPNLKIAVASYNASQARDFNRDIQRNIDSELYPNIFPGTKLNGRNIVSMTNQYLRNSDKFEIVGYTGFLKAVGRGGPLTGSRVDVAILDDLYKDYEEGNSPVIREAVKKWYFSVVRTRFHNDSKQLIVFTRWHEDDLIGEIEQKERVINLTRFDQLENIDPKAWYKINFPAISTEASILNEFDRRDRAGLALWPARHNLERLQTEQQSNNDMFSALYQGSPEASVGLLYQKGFKIYSGQQAIVRRQNYTDSADQGKDYLCSICYGLDIYGNVYIEDLIYTTAPNEETEITVSKMLLDNNTEQADVEGNAGGRGFARALERITSGRVYIKTFTQTKNKEARIISNSSTVQDKIFFPDDWIRRWPEFAKDVLSFKRNFRANKNDDGPDALTGIIEKTQESAVNFEPPKLSGFSKNIVEW